MDRRIFLSYAHQDQAAKAKFTTLLNQYLLIANGVNFTIWQDLDILPGRFWDEEIKNALKTCDVGLLLVSPAFLGSKYIVNIELPELLEKGVIPVALEPVRFNGTMKLHGLKKTQVFHSATGRAFGELTTSQTRRRFVDDLFTKIMAITQVAQ